MFEVAPARSVRRRSRTRAGALFLLPLLAVLATASCAGDEATLEVVPADPARGFNYPYVLYRPADPAPDAPAYLLVEPNNTGTVSDDFAVHLAEAKRQAERAICGHVSRSLGVPLLVPVFPRPEERWRIYTHLLDRDVMDLADDPMARPDRQLLAMIDDARERLAAEGRPVAARVLMNGFSACGTFVNRFTMLHPDRVQAVACGGVNGLLMLPLAELDGTPLPYPLGLADYADYTGRPFTSAAWCRVPQFIYMGALDDNDAVLFDDGYSDAERALVFAVLGERMQPDRWRRCQEVYRAAGAQVTFNTYEGVGHGTDSRINDAIVAFFRWSSP